MILEKTTTKPTRKDRERLGKINLLYSIHPDPLFWVIGGPTGGGKSSLVKATVAYLERFNRKAYGLLTDKTREPRPALIDEQGRVIMPAEQYGVDARFISYGEYKGMMDGGNYAAHFERGIDQSIEGHGYRKKDIRDSLRKGQHLFVQTIDQYSFVQLSTSEEGGSAAVPIIIIASRKSLEQAIKERPTFSEEERNSRLVSLPEDIEGFLDVYNQARYVIFKSPEFYKDIISDRFAGVDTTMDQLLRIMERETTIRRDRELYRQCETPHANNQNLIEFLTAKIIGKSSFENLQRHLREKRVFRVRYEDINPAIVSHFLATRHPPMGEDTLKYYFPLNIIAATDAHGRRSIILTDYDDPRGKQVISTFFTFWMDTYHNLYRSEEPYFCSPSGLVELVDRTGNRNVPVRDGAVFYLTHNLERLGNESLNLPPYALNIAFANIGGEGAKGLELALHPLDDVAIRRFKGEIEERAVINRRLNGYDTQR